MTDEEKGIMRDAYYFLRDNNDPPAPGTEKSDAFWDRAAKDLGRLAGTWKKHPLATGVMTAIYDYLEAKGKQKGVGSG